MPDYLHGMDPANWRNAFHQLLFVCDMQDTGAHDWISFLSTRAYALLFSLPSHI